MMETCFGFFNGSSSSSEKTIGWNRGAVNHQNDDIFTMLNAEDRQKKQVIDSLLSDAMKNLTHVGHFYSMVAGESNSHPLRPQTS